MKENGRHLGKVLLAVLLVTLGCLPSFGKGAKRAEYSDDLRNAVIGNGVIALTTGGPEVTADTDGVNGEAAGSFWTYEDVGPIIGLRLEPKPNWRDYFYPWNKFKEEVETLDPTGHLSFIQAVGLQQIFEVPKIILGGDDIIDANDLKHWYAKNVLVADKRGKPVPVMKDPPYGIRVPPLPELMQYVPCTVILKVGIEVVAKHVLWRPDLPSDGTKNPPIPHLTCRCPMHRPCPSDCSVCGGIDPATNLECHCFDATDQAHWCYDGKDIAKQFLDECVDIKKKDPLDGDVEFKIVYRDRTPPRIYLQGDDTPQDQFPQLGGAPDASGICPPLTATTGDFYSPVNLVATDNSGDKIFSCFGIGRLSGPTAPGPYGTPPEDWEFIGSIGVTLPGETLASHVFLPNDCLGEMKYTVFAWDLRGVLNPGEPRIEEDHPEVCYMIRGPHSGEDLVTDPRTAQPFPYKAPVPPPTDMALLDINRRITDGEGIIWVDDNDRPNVIIRVRSMRDPDDVLFFPPVSVASLQTISDTMVPDDDYSRFIEGASILVEDMPDGFTPDFELLKLGLDDPSDPRALMPKTECAWAWKFGIEPQPYGEPAPDPEFVRKNFRLENFAASDNDLQGNPIVADEKTFGERNGFGKSATLAYKKPLVEDVEYEITVWAEDNVHYMNNWDGHSMTSPFSGVRRGQIDVEVPNQVPPVRIHREWIQDQFKAEPLRVVLREPTTNKPDRSMTDATLRAGYPSVSVKVEDHRGNERALTVFFEVTDEKTRIRVLEQKHKKEGER
ncbi:MAG: hypothetical protein GX442_12110 [Candidatus Riflebacteria bacterium]|nr:hypothetical protein [Candidatus Riflebacteria bacterium]